MTNFYENSEDIKVAVIGYGGAFNMGQYHLVLGQKAGLTPQAVVELDPSRLEAARTDFPGIETYESVDRMLEESSANLVVIITPHNTHQDLALQCLGAGRHVVCEKPLAITAKEVDEMIAAANSAGVVLSTFHNRHWDGCILEAVDRVREQKVVGDIVRIDCHMLSYGNPGDWWRSSRSISGGILYDWGVHLLEYSLQLIDSPVIEVAGYAHSGYWGPHTRWGEDTVEDEAFAVVRFASGQWLTLHFSNVDAKGMDSRVRVTGTGGVYAFDERVWQLYQRPEHGRWLQEKGLNRESDAGLSYYLNLRDHLVDGAELVITADWSRRPIEILDLAVQSATAGRALPVPEG